MKVINIKTIILIRSRNKQCELTQAQNILLFITQYKSDVTMKLTRTEDKQETG